MNRTPAGTALAPELPELGSTHGAAARRPDGSWVPADARLATGVSGLLLCGGRSRRMGFDKARLPIEGRTLVERCAEQLEAVTDELLIASGPARRYEELLGSRVGRRWVLDAVQPTQTAQSAEPREAAPAGPLVGLLAGLEASRSEWVLAVACDMPGVDAALLRALVEQARATDLDVCLAATADAPGAELRPQPLLGVYRRRLRPCLRQALRMGRRRLVDFHGLALPSGELPRVGRLELPPGSDLARRAAANLNDPGDVLGFGLALPQPTPATRVRPR